MVAFVVGAVCYGACLWVGMKLTGVRGTFIAMALIALISAACGLVPTVGGVLSVVVMFILLVRWTGADFWLEAVLLVVVARLVEMAAGLGVSRACGSNLSGIEGCTTRRPEPLVGSCTGVADSGVDLA
jgi:hypothetical protein